MRLAHARASSVSAITRTPLGPLNVVPQRPTGQQRFRVEATMHEKSDKAPEQPPTVPELDETIFSLAPEGGITTRMRRRLLLRRFWQSAAGFWRGRSARRAWLLSAAILALILVNLAASYAMNVWNREIFNGLEQRDAGRVLNLSLIHFPLLAASVCLGMGQTYARMTLQRRWRAWLTDDLLDR